MAVECESCKTPATTVAFRAPAVFPKEVRILWFLVIAAAVIAVWNALEAFINIIPVSDFADTVKAIIDENPGQTMEEEQFNDMGRLFYNVVTFIGFLLLVVLVYLPVRYTSLLRKFRKGAPTTYWQLRSVAIQTLLVSVLLLFTWIMLFSDLVTFHVNPPVGLNLLIAPAILIMARKSIVRDYFSQFEWKQLDTIKPLPAAGFVPIGGVQAAFVATAPAPAPSWSSVPAPPPRGQGWEVLPAPTPPPAMATVAVQVERPRRLQCPRCSTVIEAARGGGMLRCPNPACGYAAPSPF